jgi:hypothetical protein
VSEQTDKQVVVGHRGKRRDPASTPVVTNWQTDVITDREPGFVYEFAYYDPDNNNDTLSRRLHPTRIQLHDYANGTSEVFDIPAWEVCHRDTGPEQLAGFAPSEGKPVDTVLRHGGKHVAIRIKQEHWDILQRAQEQRAESYQQRVDKGGRYEFDSNGATSSTDGDLRPGNIRLTQKPIARV